MPVRQRRKTTAQGSTCGSHCETALLTLLCETTHDLLVPVEPVSSWCPISRSQCNWGAEASPNLGKSAEMRFVSTALVMMTIALLLIALMLLGPAAHAKSDTFVANLGLQISHLLTIRKRRRSRCRTLWRPRYPTE